MPNGWAVTYFPEICALEKGSIKRGPFGSSITKAMFVPRGEDTYKVYEQGNAIRKTVEYGDYWLPKSDYQRLEGFAVKARDIIVSCAGTIGETFVIPKDAPEGVINQALLRLTLNHEIIDEQYFLLMFKSLVDTLKSNAVGSAIKNLASIKFLKYETPFLLPPIDEQRRIVSKVQEAFEKVELYGRWFNRLQTINKEFPEKLRKSILQYAMQGKLVPQDPNDEPVEVLLEKIRQEKQKLYEEGKLKKKDLQESIIYKGDDNSYYEKLGKIEAKIEVPFDLPNNYVWKRIRDIYYNDGQTKPRNTFKYIDTGTIDNKSHQLLMGNIRKISATQAPSRARKKVSVNSVLFSSVRPYLTNAAIFEEDNPDDYIASTAFVVMNPILVSSQYLLSVLISPFMIEEMNKKSTGSNYPAINDTNFNTLLVPVTSKSVQDQMVTRLFEFDKYISQIG
ncbi:restriction endonuclease subunit S [Enterococcus hirae]|nr:restriction endonuclease subunit S [Enterococcus hirae]